MRRNSHLVVVFVCLLRLTSLSSGSTGAAALQPGRPTPLRREGRSWATMMMVMMVTKLKRRSLSLAAAAAAVQLREKLKGTPGAAAALAADCCRRPGH